MQAVGLHAQVLLARGERGGHRVERAGELADLPGAELVDARVELAALELLGGAADAADRDQDAAVEDVGEPDEQQDGEARATGADRQHALAQLLGAGAAIERERLLGVAQRGELGAERVEALLALGRGFEDRSTARAGDERLGVVADVAVDVGRDRLHARVGGGVARGPTSG